MKPLALCLGLWMWTNAGWVISYPLWRRSMSERSSTQRSLHIQDEEESAEQAVWSLLQVVFADQWNIHLFCSLGGVEAGHATFRVTNCLCMQFQWRHPGRTWKSAVRIRPVCWAGHSHLELVFLSNSPQKIPWEALKSRHRTSSSFGTFKSSRSLGEFVILLLLT